MQFPPGDSQLLDFEHAQVTQGGAGSRAELGWFSDGKGIGSMAVTSVGTAELLAEGAGAAKP